METAWEVIKILFFLAIGIGGIAWQVVQYREKMGWTILWIGIIPLPIGIAGILSVVVSIVMAIDLFSPAATQ